MDSAQMKTAFDRDGYVHIKGFMSPQEVKDLNRNLDRYIAEVLPGLGPDAAFYEVKGQADSLMRLQGMCDNDAYFKELYYSQPFINLGELLLGDSLVGKNMQWFNKPAHLGRETPPHQDGFYFMLEPNEAITLWLAQDHIDTGNGCVRYLPGSHRDPMRPHGRTDVLGFSQGITDYTAADREAEIPVCTEPGDLIAHHCLTVHRADANTTPAPRRALGLVYFAERAKEDAQRAAAYREELYRDWQAAGKL
jgi:phytanoyl-CoA hydroxylase